ncbi:hypothetical protein BD769DRAFT_1694391 [Suillus cothurnatus]|nr:hypothetical protein BD769DRAFT_1694391 [Suillus cothurnatus]
MTNCPSQRNGKAAIPKPARGLGLNPSGLPAADQLNIPAEQPSVSAFSFNPHEESMQQSGGPDQHSFHGLTQNDNSLTSSSTMFGTSQSGGVDQHSFHGLTQYDDSHASSSTLFGASQSRGTDQHPFHGFTQYNSTSYGYPYDQDRDQLYNSSSLSNPQPNFSQPHNDGDQLYDGSSLINPQPNLSQPQDDSTSYDRYTYDQDRFKDSGDQLYDCSALTMPGVMHKLG